jgi:membrane protease YdiL (CAAX protease family)
MKTKKISLFIGLTFLLSWSAAFLFYLCGGKWNTHEAVILGLVYMFMPMTSTIIAQSFVYKESFLSVLRLNFALNRWFFVAWLLPPVLGFLAFGVSLLLPGVTYSTDMSGMYEMYKDIIPPADYQQMYEQMAQLPLHPVWLALAAGLAAGITINALAGYGEELGWRGFLYDELQPLGFWKSSLLIGVIWGVWHAPLILQGHNYPHYPLLGVPMMIVWCVLLSPLFCFIRLKSKSVIPAAIMHGTLNGTFTLAVFLVKGGNELLVGITGISGFIVLALVNVGIFVFQRYKPVN